jgi:uncharacterized membrane protein YbhN (UPF0104 family)
MSLPRLSKVAAVVVAGSLATACMVYLITSYDWREAWRAIRGAHLFALVVATLVLQFAFVCVRTLRWQLIVQDGNRRVGFANLYWTCAIAISLSIVTPGQIGEALKVELLKRQGLGRRITGLGSFAIERVLDLVAVAGFCLIGLVFASGLLTRYPQLPIAAALLVAVGLIALRLLRPAGAGQAEGWFAHFRAGTGTSPVRLKMMLLTLISWCLVGAGWQVSLHSVGVDISLAAVCWLISLVTVGTLLSLIPAGVGVADVIVVHTLISLGVPEVNAQAAALVLRIYAFIVMAFGLGHLLAWPLIPRTLRGHAP